MTVRQTLFVYLFLTVLLLLFTALAAVIIGVEARLLSRFAPLSGAQFAPSAWSLRKRRKKRKTSGRT